MRIEYHCLGSGRFDVARATVATPSIITAANATKKGRIPAVKACSIKRERERKRERYHVYIWHDA